MRKSVVGFDSVLFQRRMIETPEKVFKAFISVGITTEDENQFRKRYDEALDKTFKQKNIRRKKLIYKGHHFILQAKDNTTEMICDVLEDLADSISRIDLYCGYYDLEEISVFGEASGQVIKRMTFLEKNQHSFHHVCTWRYLKDYGSDCKFKLDHFSGQRTPAWLELIDANPNIEIYFKGCECDPLISTSDLVLKLLQLHQYGTISGRSLFQPITKRCPSFSPTSRKLNYHPMKRYLRMTTPIVPLLMNTTPYIKHPIFFIVWNPEAPRSRVRPMFEWSPLYDAVIKKAYEENGCLKFVSPEEDQFLWDCEKDKLIAWSEVDEEMIKWMRKMDVELPQVLKKDDLLP